MDKRYYYLRFKWWRKVDLKAVEQEMGEGFTVERINTPEGDINISGTREKLRVKADTLAVNLSPERAVLYQREADPFTPKDVELRKRIIELYPRDRPTPFPLFFQDEPKFKVTTKTVEAQR